MGLSIVRPDINLDFIGKRWYAIGLSTLIILAGVVLLIARGGPRYGIDFAGGIIAQIKFADKMDLEGLKHALSAVDLPGLVVQTFGEGDSDYLVRASASDATSESVRASIDKALGEKLAGKGYSIQRMEMVGPKVGAGLRAKALEALFYATLLIAVYVSGRFEGRWVPAIIMSAGLACGIYLLNLIGVPTGWMILAMLSISLVLSWKLRLNFSLGAVVAIIHDVMITVSILALMNKEFDLNIIAALLTIVGYSLNDTIIVYDRIREDIRGTKPEQFPSVVNMAINQTLSRTILTSGTTLTALLCLFFFGGSVIHDFALAMIVGIVAGTYSSIYVASPILVEFGASPGTTEAPKPVTAKPFAQV